MKIDFTKSQYRDFVMAVELARHICSGLGGEREAELGRIEAFRDYLLKFAYEFECDDMVEESDGKIELRENVHHKVDEILSDYDEYAFWDDLAARLGERDAIEKVPPENLEQLNDDLEYREEKIAEFAERYEREFGAHGLSRLRIQE